MRREGRFKTSRKICHCCAGTAHRLTCCTTHKRKSPTLQLMASNPRHAERLQRRMSLLFRAWRTVVFGDTDPAVAKQVQDNRNHKCCGCSPEGAKRCFGHNYSHVARCGMCKPGRRQGPGGAKALKKVNTRISERVRSSWLAVVDEARAASHFPPLDSSAGTLMPECEEPLPSCEETFSYPESPASVMLCGFIEKEFWTHKRQDAFDDLDGWVIL